jgi:hypothetical protein
MPRRLKASDDLFPIDVVLGAAMSIDPKAHQRS